MVATLGHRPEVQDLLPGWSHVPLMPTWGQVLERSCPRAHFRSPLLPPRGRNSTAEFPRWDVQLWQPGPERGGPPHQSPSRIVKACNSQQLPSSSRSLVG